MDQANAAAGEVAHAPYSGTDHATHKCTEAAESSNCQAIKASHSSSSHTFVVTTVHTQETVTTTEHKAQQILTAVPVASRPLPTPSKAPPSAVDTASCSSSSAPSNAIVPLSSSLPSKLLRFHAKRSAQALLHQAEQTHSLDSQFGSDEGAVGGSASASTSSGGECNDCADIYDVTTPTAPPLSPVPPVEGLDDKLIDVGMGSSIEGSEESEEDDELKPLAVDNHVLHEVDLGSPVLCERQTSPQDAAGSEVLSEANLEKFRKHHHHHLLQNLDNIYLHPNFKYELEAHTADKDIPEQSPPPAVAPANSPTNSPAEQKRVHRSFLTMKKPTTALDLEVERANSAFSVTTTSSNPEQSCVNEIDTLDPALVPGDELAAEIVDAVEFYFSNESILKDAFLLKHVRRNKEGFVSLKLVSSFKRVRQLTKEWKVVGAAVRRKSRKIELNDVGTKVRRVEPLPNFDETMPSRTIVACDLPLDKLTIEKVSDIFSKCGEIALIRILKPGMAIPVDVRQFMNKYPEMQQKECALVEYLESSSARDAKNLDGHFQVFDMVAPKKKTGKKAIIQVAAPVARMVENYRYYNDATYERTRGGSFSGIVPHDSADLRFKLKRNNSDMYAKTYADVQHIGAHQQPPASPSYHHSHGHAHHHHQYHQQQHPLQSHQPHSPTHRGSFGSEHATHPFQHYQPRGSIAHESLANNNSNNNNMSFYAYSPRRYSNTSTVSAGTAAADAAAAAGSTPPATPTTATAVANNNGSSNNNSSCNNNNSNALVRRLSNCSDNNNYCGYATEMTRRSSNCSETLAPQRRDSNCSENCPCARRISDYGQGDVYRKTSQGSIGSGGERRFSNGSMQFERTFSNASELGQGGGQGGGGGVGVGGNCFPRRMSNDFNYERKQSIETQIGSPYDNDGNVGGGGGGYNVFPRRYSNNFNVGSKMAAYDNAQYINGRRISTDSGYDRRCSFGSEYEGSPRSRTSSFLSNYKHGGGGGGGGMSGPVDFDGQPRSRTGSFLDGSPRSRSGSLAQRNAENLVRTPIGPDGSKGFGSRARKFGQTISPVN